MLKKHSKHLIIALFQITGIGILILACATLMLNQTGNINHWRDFFARFHSAFFIIHSVFYIAIYCLWPRLINGLTYRQPEPPTPCQIKKAMHARYYLIGAFLMIEGLNLLR